MLSEQIDRILATIRHMESGGNYTAYNAGGGASGAYQYIQSTWTTEANQAGYGQYAGAPASAAPPNVQDAVAAFNVRQILKQYHSVGAVPLVWYYPAAIGNPSLMDSVPFASAGNTLTPAEYQTNWLSYYNSIGGSGGNQPIKQPMRTRPGGEPSGQSDNGSSSSGNGGSGDILTALQQYNQADDNVPNLPQSTQTVGFFQSLPGWGLFSSFFGSGSGKVSGSQLYAPSIGEVPDGGGIVGSFVGGINSVTDFLKMMAIVLNPYNWLRAIEFLTGLVLMGFGIWAAIQGRGERAEGFQTSESALSRSGFGRVTRELAASVTRDGKAAKRVSSAKRRVGSAPHATRRQALRVRYEREQQVASRRKAANRAQ